jgi:hypothetical protein
MSTKLRTIYFPGISSAASSKRSRAFPLAGEDTQVAGFAASEDTANHAMPDYCSPIIA